MSELEEKIDKLPAIGAPNSPARWLSENISSIPSKHNYALMQCGNGGPTLVISGTKKLCQSKLIDDTIQVVCELSKYRQSNFQLQDVRLE